MRRALYFSTIFLIFGQAMFAQEYVEKTYFSKMGRSSDAANAYYYRVKEKGADRYKSYYIHGESIFFDGTIIKADRLNEGNNVYAGQCTWYYKKGQRKTVRNFDEKGVENGISYFYYESGKLWKEIEYRNGKMVDNRYNEYNESGQANRIFQESFDNNSNDWDLFSSEKSSASIEDGQLVLSSHTNEGTSRYISFYSESEDYILEAFIDIEDLKYGDKTGLIYGFKDWSNFNFYLITQSSFYIGTVYEGVKSIRSEGMYSSDLIEKDVNNIKIISIGKESIYSINGSIQFSIPKYINHGSYLGIAVSGKSTVKVNKLIFKEVDFKNTSPALSGDLNVKATGSGFIFSEDGYVITNHHVIANANKVLLDVKTKNGIETYNAKVMVEDTENDLAILKITDTSFHLAEPPKYSFRMFGGIDVGAGVFTIGFPLALSGMGKEAKYTDGKISSKTGYNNAINVYQTSIPVQPGNSGGPLFNGKGELVGVINAKITDADNVSYAIKVNYITTLIDLLPGSVQIPMNNSLKGQSVEEMVKVLLDYVTLIKIK